MNKKNLILIIYIVLVICASIFICFCIKNRRLSTRELNQALYDLGKRSEELYIEINYELDRADVAERELEKIANNDESAEELITNVYSFGENKFSMDNHISDIIKEYKPECVRRVGKHKYYIIYKFNDGSYVFLLYDFLYGGSRDLYYCTTGSPVDFWLCYSNVTFEEIQKAYKDNLYIYDVKKIDHYGNYSMWLSSFRMGALKSFHHTSDRYRVELIYDDFGYVRDIKNVTNDDNSLFKYMLPIDYELCKN